MDAQMDLRSTAILTRIDTIAIERNNSLLRSFVVGWAQQARVVDLGHVNDRWIGKFASNQSRGSTIWNHPYVAQPPPPPPVATDDRVADDSAVQQPPQKRKRKKRTSPSNPASNGCKSNAPTFENAKLTLI